MTAKELIATLKRDKLMKQVITLVTGVNFGTMTPTAEMGDLALQVCGENINALSDYTLSLLCDPSVDDEWKATVAKGIFGRWDDQMVKDFLHNGQLLHDESPFTDLNITADYLKLMKRYEELVPSGEQYSSEREQQVAIVIQATRHLLKLRSTAELHQRVPITFQKDSSLPYIIDERLRALLLTSKHREAVLEMLTKRSIYDVDNLIDLVGGSPAALTAGVL